MIDIFNEISQTINLIGQEKTIDLLRKGRENTTKPINVKEVFNAVCNVFDLKIDHIDDLKKQTDIRLVIFSFCAYYCWKKLRANVEDFKIGMNVNISKVHFYRFINTIKKANFKKPKSTIDKMIADNNEKINILVNQILKNKT